MAEFGLTPEDYAADVVGVFPDNISSVNVFIAMSTQWSMGPAGPIGLRYEVLPEIWRRTGIPAADRSAVFDDLRVLEDAALEAIRQQ